MARYRMSASNSTSTTLIASAFHRRNRVFLDRQVRRGYLRLGTDWLAQATFTQLLITVRERSDLLRPVGDRTRYRRIIDALMALARRSEEFIRETWEWRPECEDMHGLIHSLAEHLLARYPVPRCFTSAWLGGSAQEQQWFVEHGKGTAVRRLAGFPPGFSRKMERVLLTSPVHLRLGAAIRRAEILGLGGSEALADAVLAFEGLRRVWTPEAEAFWRGVMHFFVNNEDDPRLDATLIGELLEFIVALRFREARVWTLGGEVSMGPPQPRWSIAGRTLGSMIRLLRGGVESRRARRRRLRGGDWGASGYRSVTFEQRPGVAAPQLPALAGGSAVQWCLTELTSSVELSIEGQALRHCVATYTDRCMAGISSIWSLRRREGDGAFERRYTIEVIPNTRRIIQVRGYANRQCRGFPRRILALWATQEGLSLGTGV